MKWTISVRAVETAVFLLSFAAPLAALDLDPQILYREQLANTITHGVAVAGSYAYVAEDSLDTSRGFYVGRLRIINITDPSKPQSVSTINLLGSPYQIALAGTRVFVAAGEAGLQVIDVRDPSNPAQVGAYQTIGVAQGIAVAGDYGYLALAQSGLEIIDLRDAASPQRVSAYTVHSPAIAVTLAAHLALLSETNGVHIINVEDPLNPRRMGLYPHGATSIAADGQFACLLGAGTPFEIMDFSTPENPVRAAAFPSSPALTGLDPLRPGAIAISGPYAYVSAGSGLHIIDIADRASPRRLSSSAVNFYLDAGESFKLGGVALSSNHVIVALGAKGGIAVLDPRKPANPQKISDAVITNPGMSAMAVSGQHLYAAGKDGIRILDMSDPHNLKPAGLFSGLANVASLTVTNDHAYAIVRTWSGGTDVGQVGGYGASFYVLNLSNATNIELAGSVGLGFFGTGGDGGGAPPDETLFNCCSAELPIAGHFAYVFDNYVVEVPSDCGPRPCGTHFISGTTISIVDLSNPSNPRKIGSIDGGTNTFTRSLTAFENYLIWAGSWGVQTLDITDPSNPQPTDSARTRRHAAAAEIASFQPFAVQGDYAYIADDFFGLKVFDLSQPSVPLEVSRNSTFDRVGGIRIANGKLLVATEGPRILAFHEYRPARFEQLRRENAGPLTLRVAGPPGVLGRVQRSSDLATWSDWLPVTFTETASELSDPAAPEPPAQFFRIEMP